MLSEFDLIRQYFQRRQAARPGTVLGIGDGKEMAAFDQHVGRDRHLATGRWLEQRTIVADAKHGAGAGGLPTLEVLLDEVEFGEHGRF